MQPAAESLPHVVGASRQAVGDKRLRGSGSVVLSSSTFELSSRTLLRFLTSTEQRPNLLIVCSAAEPKEVVEHLLKWCALPLRYCALPGLLKLPPDRHGTLLLQPVEGLTLTQQIALYDWINRGDESPQIVSVASRPLKPIVLQGRFLEGLFHRLSELQLDARSGEPSRSWRERLIPRIAEDEDRVH